MSQEIIEQSTARPLAEYIDLATKARDVAEWNKFEAILAQAYQYFPDDRTVRHWRAWSAFHRHDWGAAADRWCIVVKHEPEDFSSNQIYLQSLRCAGRFDIAYNEIARVENAFPEQDLSGERAQLDFAVRARSVLEKFESLGCGCEFGTLQRALGLEPLGLFRWSAIDPPALIKGLNTRFDRLGGQDTTHVVVNDNDWDYRLIEDTLPMEMHTWIAKNNAESNKVKHQMCGRLRLLSRKLMEDLENAEKIFVYRHHKLDFDHIVEIHRAVQVYGRNRLLVVTETAHGEEPGSVERWSDTLLRGYVGYSNNFDGKSHSDFASWAKICEKTKIIFEVE